MISLCVLGPGEESPHVRCARGGGGPEGADQGTDRAQLAAGAGEHTAEDAGQPGADGPVPGPGPDRLPTRRPYICRSGASKRRHPRPAGLAQLRPLGVAQPAQMNKTD